MASLGVSVVGQTVLGPVRATSAGCARRQPRVRAVCEATRHTQPPRSGHLTARSASGRQLSSAAAALPCPSRRARRARRSACTVAQAVNNAQVLSAAEQLERNLTERLILTWIASRRGSRFALWQLVMTAAEAYTAGVTVSQLRLQVSLVSMGSQDDPLPAPAQQDALVSCAAVVMQTLRELGIGSGEKRPEALPDPDVEKGLSDFVSNALLMTESGFSLFKLELQHQMDRGQQQGYSEFAELMRTYNRLVLMTFERFGRGRKKAAEAASEPAAGGEEQQRAAAAQREEEEQEEEIDGEESDDEGRPEALAASRWQPLQVTADTPEEGAAAEEILLAFIGASGGNRWATRKLAEALAAAYARGVPAAKLHATFSPNAFLLEGRLVQSGASQPGDLDRELLGLWISLSYVVQAGAGNKPPMPFEEFALTAGLDMESLKALSSFVKTTLAESEAEYAAEAVKAAAEASARAAEAAEKAVLAAAEAQRLGDEAAAALKAATSKLKAISSWDDRAKAAVARSARAAAAAIDPIGGPVDALLRWAPLAAAATAAVRNEVAATAAAIGEELQSGPGAGSLVASGLPQEGLIADPFLADTSPALRVMRQQSMFIIACHKEATAGAQQQQKQAPAASGGGGGSSGDGGGR